MPRRLPAEFEPQSGTLITWPHDDRHWHGQLRAVEQVFVELVRQINDHQTVIIAVNDAANGQRIRHMLADNDAMTEQTLFYTVASNDCWVRDHGPITIMDSQQPLILDFRFNGWNHKYPFDLDNAVTSSLNRQDVFHNCRYQRMDIVLEGGSIETNGDGCLITTSSCLLVNNRNPGFNRRDYEVFFQQELGCHETLWLEYGYLNGDDTDGHVDTLVRFADEHTVIYQQCDDKNHVDYPTLAAMEKQLIDINRQRDDPFHLVAVPSPEKPFFGNQKPLPASYVNFVITNNKVLVPAYDDCNDDRARKIIAEHFPDRQTVSINALPLIHQYGSLHCVTMQLPTGVSL